MNGRRPSTSEQQQQQRRPAPRPPPPRLSPRRGMSQGGGRSTTNGNHHHAAAPPRPPPPRRDPPPGAARAFRRSQSYDHPPPASRAPTASKGDFFIPHQPPPSMIQSPPLHPFQAQPAQQHPQEFSEEEVARAAMRIALESLSSLEQPMEGGTGANKNDFETLRKYIEICPFVDRNSPAVQAALDGLLMHSSTRSAAPSSCYRPSSSTSSTSSSPTPALFSSTPMTPPQPTKVLPNGNSPSLSMVSSSSTSPLVMVPPSFQPNGTTTSSAVSSPKKQSKRRFHSATSSFFPSWLATILQFFFLETPLALLFVFFLGSLWTKHVGEEYLTKNLERLAWSVKGRQLQESTYYKRVCDVADMSATESAQLFLPHNHSPRDAYQHQLRHGLSVFPQVLSVETATNLRNFIVKRNHEMKEEEAIFVIANENRYSFGLGTEEPTVRAAVRELSTNAKLRPALEQILGKDPALIEMTAITSTHGAKNQYWHDDVVSRASALRFSRAFGPSYSIFIQLQNTTVDMGATTVCAGTHMCPDGDMDDWCDEHGFQLVNADGYWNTGDCLLMNMNTWHRGAAHTLEGGPDRVMLILTFVPKPRLTSETRQMSQGITFSLRWDMWGHTLYDLMDPERRMAQPWTTLRALGLYKPRDASWGVDWITGSSHRMASEDNGYDEEALEVFIERGGIHFIPQFLHHRPSDDEGWYEYCYFTIVNCVEFGRKATMVGVAAYAAFLALVYIMRVIYQWTRNQQHGSYKKDDDGVTSDDFYLYLTPTPPSRHVRRSVVRFSLLMGIIYFLYSMALHHVDNTQWARDIRAGRLFSNPFDGWIMQDEYSSDLPTTNPNRNDVLIETRFKGDYLNMYNDYIQNHPGNRWYADFLKAASPVYAAYQSQKATAAAANDVDWTSAVVRYVMSQLEETQSRVLYQNSEGHWIVLDEASTMKQVRHDLERWSGGNEFVYEMIRGTENLLQECMLGRLRSTAMGQIDAFTNAEDWKLKLMGKKEQERREKEKKKMSVIAMTEDDEGEDWSSVKRLVAKPAILRFHSVTRNGIPQKALSLKRPVRNLTTNPSKVRTPPAPNAWIQEGDVVEAKYKEKGGTSKWYVGQVLHMTSSSIAFIRFDDGEESTIKTHSLREYKPLVMGEKVEVRDTKNKSVYYKASITKIHDDGETVNLKANKNGGKVNMKNIPKARLRRNHSKN